MAVTSPAAVDSIVDLLPLLFVGAYYLLAARRRATQKRVVAPQKELVSDAEPRRATPFRSFLSQLEEAMAEASGESIAPSPSPPPAVETLGPIPALAPLPSVTVGPEFHATAGSFEGTSPVNHDAHGFGRENPASEETFERQPLYRSPPPTPRSDYDPHGLRSPGGGFQASGWQARLSDPKAAQDAFVLQTVFGPRGGRRSEPRR